MSSTPFAARRDRRPARPCFPPKLETLEDRLAPASYSLTPLGVPGGGGYTSVTPTAINNSGEILAIASGQGLPDDIALYSNNSGWTSLFLDQTNTFYPFAINQSGEILGVYATNPPQLSLSISGKPFQPLNPPPNSTYVQDPIGLDDAGNVFSEVHFANGDLPYVYNAGQNQWNYLPPLSTNGQPPLALHMTGKGQILATESASGLLSYHAYIFTPGAANPWQDLGPPSGGQFVLGAINDSGQAIVQIQATGQFFFNSNGQYGNWVNIGTPTGYPDVVGRSFDNAGQFLVNASVDANSPPHPYLYNSSTNQWIDLNTLLPAGSNVTLAEADRMSSNGQIVVTGTNGNLYLLTPLPTTTPPPGGGGGPGGAGGPGSSTPIPFIQALITLYVDGAEKILNDSAAIEESIQENLPWGYWSGFDLGSIMVLEGEVAAYDLLHGVKNSG